MEKMECRLKRGCEWSRTLGNMQEESRPNNGGRRGGAKFR